VKFAGFDIETNGPAATYLSGAVFWDGGSLYTDDPRQLIAQLRRLGRSGYTLGAHNAEYEVTNLLWRYGEEVSVHYHQGHFTGAYWGAARSRRKVQVWDSYRLSGGLPLDVLGEAMHLPKWPTPQRLLGIDPDRYIWICERHDRGECQECYNVRDAEIVWAFLTQLTAWLEPHGVALSRTLPKVAYDLWLKVSPGEQQTASSPEVRQLGRDAYHGGRCEAFMFGTVQGVFTYDRKYYYASLLRDAPMPDCRRLISGVPSLETIADPENLGVVEATAWVPEMHIPPLPVVVGGVICYPVGTIRGVWTFGELRAALARDCSILEFGRGVWSAHRVYPFGLVAGTLIEARQAFEAAGDAREIIPKQLANALAGRLGMDERQERWIFKRWRAGMSSINRKGWSLETDRTHMYLCRQQRIVGVAKGANVLWAAHITAAGRVQLQGDLEAAGDSLVYCDTDSIHSLKELPSVEGIPGGLRSTGYFDQGLYLGPKLYRLESYDGASLIRAKGVPRRAAEEFLTSGRATYQTVLGVIKGIAIGREPGQWLEVERSRRTIIAARQLLNPKALREPDQLSETVPVVASLEALRDWAPRIDV
jgi:DNA polymerase type B, organellar and viral